MRYKVDAEFIPEPSYEGIEWYWKAKVTQAEEGDADYYLNESYEIEAKFGMGTREESEADLQAGLKEYLTALSTDRHETYFLEV